MKKKVWYISKYANIKKHGADTRQAVFCKYFSELEYDVRLITSNSSHIYHDLPSFSGKYFDESNDGYNVTWLNTFKYKNATSPVRLLGWIWFEVLVILMVFVKRYEKPDVVIISSLSLLSVVSGCFYKLFFKSRFIFEVRDIWPKSLQDLKGLSSWHPVVWILRRCEHLGYRYCDSIVGTMPGLSEHVEKEVGLGVKVHYIPQGVDLSFYSEHQSNVSSEYLEKYIPKDKFVVGYAGSMGVANALEYIVEAARSFNASGVPEIHFLLVGDGYLKEELIEQAKGLCNITFAPSVPKESVQSILSLCDLLVSSVRKSEIYDYGLSLNKFIDYMYAKKPVVCMFSGYPSMINESRCGEFVPSEDVEAFVDAILKYKALSVFDRKKIGLNGYNYLVLSRNFDTLTRAYLGLFK
jgi:glycosyltransferase involved in cell wall biosynthesis